MQRGKGSIVVVALTLVCSLAVAAGEGEVPAGDVNPLMLQLQAMCANSQFRDHPVECSHFLLAKYQTSLNQQMATLSGRAAGRRAQRSSNKSVGRLQNTAKLKSFIKSALANIKRKGNKNKPKPTKKHHKSGGGVAQGKALGLSQKALSQAAVAVKNVKKEKELLVKKAKQKHLLAKRKRQLKKRRKENAKKLRLRRSLQLKARRRQLRIRRALKGKFKRKIAKLRSRKKTKEQKNNAIAKKKSKELAKRRGAFNRQLKQKKLKLKKLRQRAKAKQKAETKLLKKGSAIVSAVRRLRLKVMKTFNGIKLLKARRDVVSKRLRELQSIEESEQQAIFDLTKGIESQNNNLQASVGHLGNLHRNVISVLLVINGKQKQVNLLAATLSQSQRTLAQWRDRDDSVLRNTQLAQQKQVQIESSKPQDVKALEVHQISNERQLVDLKAQMVSVNRLVQVERRRNDESQAEYSQEYEKTKDILKALMDRNTQFAKSYETLKVCQNRLQGLSDRIESSRNLQNQLVDVLRNRQTALDQQLEAVANKSSEVFDVIFNREELLQHAANVIHADQETTEVRQLENQKRIEDIGSRINKLLGVASPLLPLRMQYSLFSQEHEHFDQNTKSTPKNVPEWMLKTLQQTKQSIQQVDADTVSPSKDDRDACGDDKSKPLSVSCLRRQLASDEGASDDVLHAQRESQLARQLAEVQKSLEENSNLKAKLLSEVRDLHTKLSETQSRMERTDAMLQEANNKHQRIEARDARLSQSLRDAMQRIAIQSQTIVQFRQQTDEMITRLAAQKHQARAQMSTLKAKLAAATANLKQKGKTKGDKKTQEKVKPPSAKAAQPEAFKKLRLKERRLETEDKNLMQRQKEVAVENKELDEEHRLEKDTNNIWTKVERMESALQQHDDRGHDEAKHTAKTVVPIRPTMAASLSSIDRLLEKVKQTHQLVNSILVS